MMLVRLGYILVTITICTSAYCADSQSASQFQPPLIKGSNIDCPQCGVWAISEATEVSGPHDQAIRQLDGPVGNICR